MKIIDIILSNKPNFDFFFNRLKDNAIKKYNAFYDDDFELESDLFSGFELVREVSVRVKKMVIHLLSLVAYGKI